MPESDRPGARRAMIGRPGPLTIGIDIGGTKVLGGVVDSFGTVLTSPPPADARPQRPRASRTPSSSWSTS